MAQGRRADRTQALTARLSLRPASTLQSHTVAVSFLDDLKRQAQARAVQHESDPGVAARNARLANVACRATLDYWTEMVAQLNLIGPEAPGRYLLDGRTTLQGLRSNNFRVAHRVQKQHDGSEHFDLVALSWQLRGSGERLRIVKDFPPEIERLRQRLSQGSIQAHETPTRHAGSGLIQATQFEFVASISASIRLVPLHNEGRVRLCFSNLDALERIEADFPAFAMRSAQLDDMARWIVGEPQTLLKYASDVKRHLA